MAVREEKRNLETIPVGSLLNGEQKEKASIKTAWPSQDISVIPIS